MERPSINAVDHLAPFLYSSMRDRKDSLHLTCQDVADLSGIPLSSVKKFFSGAIKSPNVFYVMAVCIVLGLSLDELLGNDAPSSSSDPDAALKAEVLSLRQQLEAEQQLRTVLASSVRSDRRIISVLLLICLCMSAFLLNYFLLDLKNQRVGLFQNRRLSVFGILMLALIAVAAVSAVSISFDRLIRKINK